MSNLRATANKTMSQFNHNRRMSQEQFEISVPNATSVVNENDTANIFGKLKHLGTEVWEVQQTINYQNKEIEILKIEKDTLKLVLEK